MSKWLKKLSYLMIEKEVLGCILKDNSLINKTIIQTNQLLDNIYKLLIILMKKISLENKSIDKVTLLSDNYEYVQQMGGVDFITDIEKVGDIDNFESYEREFIDKYKERESSAITKKWLRQRERNTQTLITDLQKLDDLNYAEEVDKNEELDNLYNLPYSEENT